MHPFLTPRTAARMATALRDDPGADHARHLLASFCRRPTVPLAAACRTALTALAPATLDKLAEVEPLPGDTLNEAFRPGADNAP